MPKSSKSPEVEVVPAGAALGADVIGVDLAHIDDSTFAHIERAWQQHLVLRVRGQSLDDVELMQFSKRFGQLDRAPVRAADKEQTMDPRLAIAPEAREFVAVISNAKVDGRAIGDLGNYESHWHTDMSYNPGPPTASVLYAVAVPPSGGNTSFANMYRAYETLPEDMRQRVEGLTCIHDASHNSVGELRKGFVEVTDPRQAVGARHPIVRTHPVTGRRALFLGRRRHAYIVGLELEESERLLDFLWAHATRAELTWAQVWKAGDLIVWDNRCTLHRRDEFDDSATRIMHRTQICGDRPFLESPRA